MLPEYKKLLAESPDPRLADIRLERLLQERSIATLLQNKPEQWVRTFINIISLSNFLFHYLCRQPDATDLIDCRQSQLADIKSVANVEELRKLKYRELLRLSSLDIANQAGYQKILSALSELADTILIKLLELISADNTVQWGGERMPLALIAMGKLGARELNYSSDIDLVPVCANAEDITGDMNEYHATVVQCLQYLTRLLEEKTAGGYLYRVDLNLRPWGKHAPLVMPLDDMENYYEANTAAWERLAWLRARFVAGSRTLGEQLLKRLQPYRYRRNLSLDDLQDVVDVKRSALGIKEKTGSWNVKLGVGGIRNIEFFVQILQLTNVGNHPVLQETNTIRLLADMARLDILDKDMEKAIRESYLFLRRLENRLQMVDEAQVQELPDAGLKRLTIARSLGFGGDDVEVLENFDQYLTRQKQVAKGCFDEIRLKFTSNNGD